MPLAYPILGRSVPYPWRRGPTCANLSTMSAHKLVPCLTGDLDLDLAIATLEDAAAAGDVDARAALTKLQADMARGLDGPRFHGGSRTAPDILVQRSPYRGDSVPGITRGDTASGITRRA
jgi:hypothetical protein